MDQGRENPAGALRIVRRSPGYVVVDKPGGLLSVPGRSPDQQDCVRSRVGAMYPDAPGAFTVHRLDMETTGLIIVALTPEAHRHLNMQFESRRVHKTYTAVLSGLVTREQGVVKLPLTHDWARRPRHKVSYEDGKPAETHYRVLARGEESFAAEHRARWLAQVRAGVDNAGAPGLTRVEFLPVTGRSHQIRIHAAHDLGLGAPVLGDALYGQGDSAPRLMLHATTLIFECPDEGAEVELRCEPEF
ncbi:MAG: RluA family pseudouridine synthase [Phycisphaerales bacterium]|nr:RluA family pseudouridine synthase [Phycisphaerales bacterium]